MKFLRAFLVITILVALFFNSVPFEDAIMGVAATIITASITLKYPVMSNMGKYIVMLVVWVSVVMMPAYHLIVHILRLHDMTQIDYDRVQAFGFEVFLLVAVAFIVMGGNKKSMRFRNVVYIPHKFSDKFIVSFFYFLYALTAFCFIMGIGRLGGDPVQLPFHLSGIINLFRQGFVPVMFVMLIEGYVIRKEKLPKKYLIMYFLWAVLETFAWMSKGVLINYMVNVSLMLYWYYRPPLKKIIRLSAPFLALVLFLYPIVGAMRGIDYGSFIENFKEAKSTADDTNDGDPYSAIKQPLNRLFLTGQMYAQDFSYISKDDFFDMSRVPILVLSGGSAGYQTRVIDGYPEDANHSSGTTGIMDPLLHGGKGLCFITLFLIVAFGAFVDKQYRKRQFSLYIVLFMYIQGLCTVSNISNLYDAVGLQSTFMMCMSLFALYYFNFRNKQYSNG